MNYDQYLENSRESYEASGDKPTKTWIVVFEEEDDPYIAVSKEGAESYFNYTKSEDIKSELGWIWDRDLCQDWRKYFNVVESHGK